jgi:Omp85 superfamily domain
MRRFAAALAVTTLALPISASAQETRTEALERQRTEKASALQPYKPSKLEKLVMDAEEGKLRRRISPYNGFFVQYGHTYKPVGSGIGVGGGFRHDLFDRQARVILEAGASLRNYQLLRGDFSLPRLARGRLETGIEWTFRRQPQDDFYGVGNDSLEDDRVSFLFNRHEAQGRFIVTPKPWLHVGTHVGFLSPLIGHGKDDRFPSIEESFDDGEAPGLTVQPDFLFGDAFAEVDYRDEPGNARDGGHYTVTWRTYSDRDLDQYSFSSVDLLLQQFVPIFDKKRVFAFQLGITGTDAGAGKQVPFYMQPTIGGSRTLRSVSDYRFRDTHAMYFNAEYRWEAFGLLDMALFTDWGKVAPRTADLDFSDLKKAYGIGFRFNTSSAVFLRVDIATGESEGLHVFFKFSKAF